MALSPIDQAASLLREQIRTLDDERKNLERALSALTGSNGRTPTTRRRRSSKRAPRGQRQEQFLAAVKKNPGAGGSEIAKQMGVPSSQAYALARSLQQKGRIRKRGKGYAVKQ
ncbi:MAG: hypothetical protein ACRDMH_01225 [Solirubrobacterales bacterium]